MINLARDNPIVLELAQLLGQHLLGCVGQKSAKNAQSGPHGRAFLAESKGPYKADHLCAELGMLRNPRKARRTYSLSRQNPRLVLLFSPRHVLWVILQ